MSTAIDRVALASPTQAEARPAQIRYLDLFRGVAILQVVMIHAGNALLYRGVAQGDGDSGIVRAVLHILVHDSTIYFALISGILYGHLFWKRDHARFVKARFVNIGMPYLVVTTGLTLLFWALALRRGTDDLGPFALVNDLIVNLVTGDAWNTMWYIPVILMLYVVSPLLFALVRYPRWRLAAIVVVLLPLIFSRTGTVLTPSMFVYFTGVYVAGLMIGARLEDALDWFVQKMAWLWALALGATALLALLFAAGIDLAGPVSMRESAFYVQRLAMGSLMLVGLRAWSRTIAPLPDRLIGIAAATSFGVYFVHGPLLRPIARGVGMFVPAGQPWWALTGAILATFALGLMLSLALVYVVRRAAGSRSRHLIGA